MATKFITVDRLKTFCSSIKTKLDTLINAKQDKITANTGLSLSGTTIAHTKYSSQEIPKLSELTAERGHIKAFGNNTSYHMYMHNINVLNSSTTQTMWGLNIINNSTTKYTLSTLCSFLSTNGYNAMDKLYPAWGTTSAATRYFATTSGGSPTTSYVYCPPVAGCYSNAANSLRCQSGNYYWGKTDASCIVDNVYLLF